MDLSIGDETVKSHLVEGRNAVMEAFRSGRSVDKLFVQETSGNANNHDGPIRSILREAGKHDTVICFVPKERLDRMSETKKHQGVIAMVSACSYSNLDDCFCLAEKKGEDPFLILLDGIKDPHNLGAIIRTANLAGAHGVIITKNRSAMLTAAAIKASAGAAYYTPVVKVTNLARTIEELKKRGIWLVCADMKGESMYRLNLKGAVGIVIGNEGEGVSRLVRERCDYAASIPVKGDIDSLNASVAAGILAYEVVRARMG